MFCKIVSTKHGLPFEFYYKYKKNIFLADFGSTNLLTLKSHLSCGLCEICQKFGCGLTVSPNEINLNLGPEKRNAYVKSGC